LWLVRDGKILDLTNSKKVFHQVGWACAAFTKSRFQSDFSRLTVLFVSFVFKVNGELHQGSPNYDPRSQPAKDTLSIMKK